MKTGSLILLYIVTVFSGFGQYEVKLTKVKQVLNRLEVHYQLLEDGKVRWEGAELTKEPWREAMVNREAAVLEWVSVYRLQSDDLFILNLEYKVAGRSISLSTFSEKPVFQAFLRRLVKSKPAGLVVKEAQAVKPEPPVITKVRKVPFKSSHPVDTLRRVYPKTD